ncbi:MAG: glycosyl hydrolase [Chitinophagaceae bacterium]
MLQQLDTVTSAPSFCRYKNYVQLIVFVLFFIGGIAFKSHAQQYASSIVKKDLLSNSFVAPPDSVKPRVYWWWLFNRVDKAGITRDMEEFRAKGISGVNLICTGGYAGKAPLLGVTYQSPAWWDSV